jgi:hypothetical protein
MKPPASAGGHLGLRLNDISHGQPFVASSIVLAAGRAIGRPLRRGMYSAKFLAQSEFFKDEAMRCRDNAGVAATKADRESWLNLACRWEELLRPRDDSDGGVHTLRPMRTIYNKKRRSKLIELARAAGLRLVPRPDLAWASAGWKSDETLGMSGRA